MKKSRVLISVLFTVLLGAVVVGCDKGDGISNPVNSDNSENAYQALLDEAASGATVTLPKGTVPAGTSIKITKPLTVDGNNLEGLAITVSSSVADKVLLKNFKKAVVKVGAPSSTNASVRTARNDAAASSNTVEKDFKKLYDNSFPLHIEGCTIDKLESDTNISLYLGNGEKKSEIDEIKLKAGVEEFSFIEMDIADRPETTADEATPLAEKSKVGELVIENGVEKVNLIGGTFDDVTVADNFSGEIDFKYDKDFENQFSEGFNKEAFFEKPSIEAKDVGIVEKTGTGNVYSFTMSKEDFIATNGFVTILFMTPAQKQWMDEHNGSVTAIGPRTTETFYETISCATLENPIYLMAPTGAFTVEDPENAVGLKTIYGSEWCYVDYARAWARGLKWYYEDEDIVRLEKYRNYNKEGIITEFNGDTVTIYVNVAAIRKEDVILCNGEYDSDTEQINEAGTKVSDINLDGYTPYFGIDLGSGSPVYQNKGFDESHGDARPSFYAQFGNVYCVIENPPALYGNVVKMLSLQMDLVLYHMESNASYPDVSDVIYSSVDTPADAEFLY